MQIVRLSTVAELTPWLEQWNLLAGGAPFRRADWLMAWWRHYGVAEPEVAPAPELFVLAVIDNGALHALVPWYIQACGSRGRVVRFLGGGEVCSEYPGILCRSGDEEFLGRALAEWLTLKGADAKDPDCWDALRLKAVAADDFPVARLLHNLVACGNSIARRRGRACWRLALPDSWNDYLAMLSKGHRKQLRRLDRDYFRTGRAVMHWVHQWEQFDRGFEILVELHQRRWRGRGQAGCFASPRFREFHREICRRMFDHEHVRLGWLEVDRAVVAAEYHLAGAGTVYAYQSGIAPERLQHQPGRLANLASIRRAIERGDRHFDFLRGDEPYKAHWRAKPNATCDFSVVSSRLAARLRHEVWATGENVLHWLKSGWQLAGDFISQ